MKAGMYADVKEAIESVYTAHGCEKPRVELYDDETVEIVPVGYNCNNSELVVLLKAAIQFMDMGSAWGYLNKHGKQVKRYLPEYFD